MHRAAGQRQGDEQQAQPGDQQQLSDNCVFSSVSGISNRNNGHREALTIEFPRVVVEGLAEGAAADGARRQEALLLGDVVVVHEHAGDGRGDEGDDDGEAAEGPAEGAVLVEELGDGGTGKNVGDEGRRVEAVEDHAVAQRSHIRQEDVNDVSHAVVAYPVEDLGVC